jgi:hypothetical protein
MICKLNKSTDENQEESKSCNHFFSFCKRNQFRSKFLYIFKFQVELLVAHTTPSMCFGYTASNMKTPKVTHFKKSVNSYN